MFMTNIDCIFLWFMVNILIIFWFHKPSESFKNKKDHIDVKWCIFFESNTSEIHTD